MHTDIWTAALGSERYKQLKTEIERVSTSNNPQDLEDFKNDKLTPKERGNISFLSGEVDLRKIHQIYPDSR